MHQIIYWSLKHPPNAHNVKYIIENVTSHFNDIVFKTSNSHGNDSTWFILILIAGCQLHVYRGSSWTFVFSPYTMWPPSIIKYTPSPQKKIIKSCLEYPNLSIFLSIDWSFSTVALRVVRRQQFMTILSASAAQHALLWIERRNWPTFTWITVAFPVKNSASWLMLPTSGELFIIVLILDNGKTHCPSFSVCFSAIFNEKYKKPHNFRTLHFKINLFISETVTLYKFLFFYYMVTEKKQNFDNAMFNMKHKPLVLHVHINYHVRI